MNRFILLLIFISSHTLYSQSSANYTITFESNWSNETHPHPTNNFPSNAHWSKLVGATHNKNIVFLEMGQNATPGIEDVAELGNNTKFFEEINLAIDEGISNQIIEGDNLPTALGTIIIEDLITSEEFPILTLVSMIAPSPDWMIAINSISLLDTNGDWINEIIIDLYPYDAGTDSGMDYDSSNMDSNPQEPISSVQGVFPFSTEKVGTMTISLEEIILSTNDITNEKAISIYPNPSKDVIHVSISNSEIKRIEVFNILGEKIHTIHLQNGSNSEVDLTSLNNGVYLISILDTSNKTTLKKIIKI